MLQSYTSVCLLSKNSQTEENIVITIVMTSQSNLIKPATVDKIKVMKNVIKEATVHHMA